MVSRANVPRKMTPATRLTEAEKIELEWESLWERIGASSEWESMWERIGASCCKIQREQEAKFDELKKAILDLSLPSEGRSMATTDANSGSHCSTDFEQLECNLSPVQKTEELELPHVEGPRSHNLESHERGWDVQRSTAATNEHSDSRESHVRAGEVHRSCNSTDHDPLEVVPTPWQKTEELEPSMPLPHNLKPTKVNNINYESYFNFSHNSMSKPSKIVDYGLIEQHIGVVEDALSFTGENLGKGWKCSLHSYVDAEDVERLDHEVKGVDLKLEQYIADFSEYKTFSKANKLKKVECLPSVRQIATVRDLVVTWNVGRKLMRLPVQFPKPLVKMKFMAQHDEEIGIEGNVQRILAKAGKDRIYVIVLKELGWLFDGDYDASRTDKISEEESEVLKEMRHVQKSSLKTYGRKGASGKEVSSTLDEGSGSLNGLSFVEDQKSALCEVLLDINAHIDGPQYIGEKCFPMAVSMYDVAYICEDEVVLLNSRKQAPYLIFVGVLKSEASNNTQKLSRGEILLARGGGMTGAIHRQAQDYEVIEEDMGKQLDTYVGMLSKVTGGLVTYEGAGAIEFVDKETAGNNTIHIVVLAAVILSKSLCFGMPMTFGYFSKCLGSNGQAAIILSRVDPMKEVMGCNSKGLRKWSGVQNHYLSLEWLLIWFPKPWVKMRLGKDYSGAYGNSNVEAVDILLRDREANLNLQLEYATWEFIGCIVHRLAPHGSSARKSKLFVFQASSRTMKLKGGGLLQVFSS